MICGLDPTNTNCLNETIAITQIEFCSICSGPNHDCKCKPKHRDNFLQVNIPML